MKQILVLKAGSKDEIMRQEEDGKYRTSPNNGKEANT